MAGCSSSVKLLCDSGASVNANDFDGRTPLVLSTQMCHPRICQLLLERGADITIRDKQNKTALILGCEYGCKDAVEVLLKSGVDVKAVDGSGHDAFHYARLSKNAELVAMVKSYLDKANRDKEAARIEQWKRQDLERQNETLQESLRKYHQEQRTLLDKVNMLQQQLSQKEQLKVLLSAKEREEGARGLETVKVQLRSTLGDYSGQSVIKGKENTLVKQAHSLDSDQMLQSPANSWSQSRPPEKSPPAVGWDHSGELEGLRHELETVKRKQQASEEETIRLQSALNRKTRECQDLVQSRDTIQKQADQQEVQATEESEKALEEYKIKRDELAETLLEMEAQLKEAKTKHGNTVPAEKFDNMKNLLTNAVDEKERQLAELREDYDRVLEEVAELHRKLDGPQSLIHEVEETEEERDILREQLEELNSRIEMDFIPMKHHDETRKNMVTALEELEDKLVEASERYGKAEAQVQQLLTERATLQENISSVQSASERHQSEMDALRSQNADLTKKLGLLQRRQQHEKVKMELSSTLESVKAEMLKLEAKEKESGDELKNVKERNEKLKEELDKVLLEMKKDYISEEVVKLTQELEAQKKELDTIQEAIQSKFIPLTAAEEKEHLYSAQVKELTAKLLEMEEKYNKERSAGESNKQEKDKLQVEIESVQQRLDSALVNSEKHKDVEEEFKSKCEDLTQKLASLEQQYNTLNQEKSDLQDQNALCNTQIQNLQERLKSELTRIATYDTELKALHDAMQQAQADCKKAREAQQEEVQKVCALQKELQERRGDQASLLQQQAKAKEALEAEVAKLLKWLSVKRRRITPRGPRTKEKQQLEEEAADLSSKLLSLAEECEEAHQETTKAKEGESRAKTEKEAVQEKGRAIEREIRELKERYDESLSTICDLQRRIETSAQQTEAKDKKITELLTDVERLKQALNGLSQLAYTSNTPNKRQTQHIDTLQAQIKSLQQQLADAERQHREVVSIYRTHLLSAAQGHMDEDVQAALLQIIRMRQEFDWDTFDLKNWDHPKGWIYVNLHAKYSLGKPLTKLGLTPVVTHKLAEEIRDRGCVFTDVWLCMAGCSEGSLVSDLRRPAGMFPAFEESAVCAQQISATGRPGRPSLELKAARCGTYR
ncbi:hypothetical protein L3Q82_000169 [Scortum barcoo]|uniref:Uncharacterized protein n=1 Tax=Scortum barcoo TaxID=214431 RepID=A0ACB8XAN6_9TELE|nr:hypothetical protein L3Q82_000169 [Scortum barcoo]